MADDSSPDSSSTGLIPPDRGWQLPPLFWELTKNEKWWRDHSDTFDRHGYRLRPRFRPGWYPSWEITGEFAGSSEDYLAHEIRQIIDATDIRSGARVAIKRLRKGKKEVDLARMLSTPEMLKDPRNHCVPILDHFSDATDEDLEFIVMPFLRSFNDPPFYSVIESVDFMRQTLGGIIFLHSHSVAHRDCAAPNIMMDANLLYPKGFHPTWQARTPDNRRYVKHLRRCDVSAVKYYFVDFGISTHFDDPNTPHIVQGYDGITKAPESYQQAEYDPFPVDIFILGDVYEKHFIKVYKNMQFLAPLTSWMTAEAPADRPTAEQALAMLNTAVERQSGSFLRWRLEPLHEHLASRFFKNCVSVIREVRNLMLTSASVFLSCLR